MRENTSNSRAMRQAQNAANAPPHNEWVKTAARLGHVAIGVVYLLVGALALRVAFGSGTSAPDQEVALIQILQAPFGRILLGIVAVGLFGYLIWRLLEAFADLKGKGTDAKGLVSRTGYALSGLIYGSLGLEAARLAFSRSASQGQGQGQGAQDWTALVLQQPFGRWLVGIAGAIVIGVGIYMLYRGWSDEYKEDLAMGQMSANERKWVTWAARLGYTAQGIVLGMIGWFVLQAAVTYNASQARGLGGALNSLANQPYGPWLLAAVAVGLALYGAFHLVRARYSSVIARQ